MPRLKALWNDAKVNKGAKAAALRSACSNGRALTMACVGVLKPLLGNKWSPAWQSAGFLGSLQASSNPMTLLQQLRAYFTANPTHEAPTLEPYAISAAACEAAAQAISDAQSASNQSNTDAGNAQSNYETGLAGARQRLSGVREELSHRLAEDDARWYAFGFDKLGDSETPEAPENLTVTVGAAGSGSLFVNWDDARRAENYRVRITNITGGALLVDRLVEESEATIMGLPANVTVSITVSARNGTSCVSRPGSRFVTRHHRRTSHRASGRRAHHDPGASNAEARIVRCFLNAGGRPP